jgi:L-alanine-DL-glutamate epimerase-like enolase superfamily enzyme
VGSYSLIASLPVTIESYALAGLKQEVSSGFLRRTTVIRLAGAGEVGLGEDVTYRADEHERLQAAGPVQNLAGSHTVATFSELLGTLDLFPGGEPEEPAWRLYRRWAFESAALDLALRQAGRSLADALGRRPGPVRFVVSTRLPEPPATDGLLRLKERYPWVRFKLDPTSDWDDRLVAELAALEAVDVVDLKGAYRGTIVDQPPDPVLYRRVAEAFPEAWIEDPNLSLRETEAALRPYRDRISWDAVIHSVADIDALPFRPSALNVKPSRFGSLSALLEAYDCCDERGIHLYGGGQFELGPGREQIQILASLFHADAPNDVAPPGFNEPVPPAGLPASPLPADLDNIGFRRGGQLQEKRIGITV